MRDRFGIFGTVTRIRKLSTFGNDVKNTQQFPQDQAHAFAAVFPWGDPYTSVWDQSEGSALERSVDED